MSLKLFKASVKALKTILENLELKIEPPKQVKLFLVNET